MTIKTPKKLIEVALPLDDINIACTREKSIRHGHPSTLHLWWARRPLAAARAVIFAQMVNDPGFERHLQRGINKKDAQVERERLFGIIRKLVKWENTNNEAVLAEARAEIVKSWRETCELKWYLLRKAILSGSLRKSFFDQEERFTGETQIRERAVVYVYTWLIRRLLRKKLIFNEQAIWCADNGDGEPCRNCS